MLLLEVVLCNNNKRRSCLNQSLLRLAALVAGLQGSKNSGEQAVQVSVRIACCLT